MSKTVYILSTLTAPQLYTTYREGGADLPQVEHQIHIHGGANVANKRLVTPQGVVTAITEEELALLETNHVFRLHKENGFITVSKSKPADADAAAASQANRDGSSPLVEGDFADGKAPSTGSASADDAAPAAQTRVAPAQPTNPRRA